MKLKQYCRYQMNFSSKWVEACPILMGLGFFAAILYYFAITTIRDVPAVELVAAILGGILATAAFVVCVTVLRLNAPGLYAIFAAVQCFSLILLSFSTGDALRIVLTILWYLLSGAVFMATAGGYLPGRLLAALMFFIPIPVRILFFDIGKITLLQWVREFSVLFALGGIGCIAMGFVGTARNKR